MTKRSKTKFWIIAGWLTVFGLSIDAGLIVHELGLDISIAVICIVLGTALYASNTTVSAHELKMQPHLNELLDHLAKQGELVDEQQRFIRQLTSDNRKLSQMVISLGGVEIPADDDIEPAGNSN